MPKIIYRLLAVFERVPPSHLLKMAAGPMQSKPVDLGCSPHNGRQAMRYTPAKTVYRLGRPFKRLGEPSITAKEALRMEASDGKFEYEV